MHIQQPSVSPDCTPYEGRHLDPKSPPSICSGACLVAVQTLGEYAGASVTLGPTALLPASILTTPALPSYWPACAWAAPLPGQAQPPWPDLSQSHLSRPGTVASLPCAVDPLPTPAQCLCLKQMPPLPGSSGLRMLP